jgi:hypothetical protein
MINITGEPETSRSKTKWLARTWKLIKSFLTSSSRTFSDSNKAALQCIAMDWKRTPEGMDYVPCDGTEAEPCEIEGLLLTVPASLCTAHQIAFHKTGADIRIVGRKDGDLIHRKWEKA